MNGIVMMNIEGAFEWLKDIELRLRELERMVNEKRVDCVSGTYMDGGTANPECEERISHEYISTIPRSKTVMGRVKEKKRYGDGCA